MYFPSEFNAIIHREIQNQPALIYERLGAISSFFYDEFQDTSEMQWQNLIPLIDNALSGQDIMELTLMMFKIQNNRFTAGGKGNHY
jgi:ATP-dependent exoDNAse (exonuclease V) beta subunit